VEQYFIPSACGTVALWVHPRYTLATFTLSFSGAGYSTPISPCWSATSGLSGDHS